MTNPKEVQKLLDAFIQELRRGSVVLAVLSQLEDSQYGYSLISKMAEKGFEIDQGTLYPLLRRLEGQGLLESEWVVADESRPRRYYKLSDPGKEIYTALHAEWKKMVQVLEGVL